MLTRCHKLVAAGNKGAIGGAASKEVSDFEERLNMNLESVV